MWIKILNACDKRVIKYAEYCSIYNTSPVSSAVPCLHFAVSFSETWCCYLHILSAIVLAKSARAGRHPSIQKLPDPPHKEKQIYSKCGNRGSVRWKRHCEGLSKGKDLLKEEHGVPPASGWYQGQTRSVLTERLGNKTQKKSHLWYSHWHLCPLDQKSELCHATILLFHIAREGFYCCRQSLTDKPLCVCVLYYLELHILHRDRKCTGQV